MRRLSWTLLAACTLLAVPASAQSRAQLKRDLQTKEEGATDVASLMEVAAWAKEQGLLTDYKRLLNKVLKLEPEHEGAMTGLGFVRYKDEWMLKSKVELLKKKEQEAAFEAQGLQKVDGVWVTEAEVVDAKKGIFHHDGEVVSRADKLAFLEDKVRHPVTGEFIAKEDLAKAQQGLFPAGERWVDAEEANRYHAGVEHPWVFRTYYATVVTTAPLDQFEDLKGYVDSAIESIKPLFGGEDPHPEQRPVVLACGTTDVYRQVGNQIGSESSVYGAFVADSEPMVDGVRFAGPPAVANWGEANWGPYFVRHAAGLAYASAASRAIEAELPLWILVGSGSLAERLYTPGIAAFFGKQHLSKGGVEDVKGWFASFEISPEVPDARVQHNVFQAGLMLAFAMRGGDQQATAAVQAFTAAFDKDKKAVERAAQELEKVLCDKEEQLRAYLKEVVSKEG